MSHPTNTYPIRHNNGHKFLSDDDLCSTCSSCWFCTNASSTCRLGWPGREDADGFVISCEQYVEGENPLQ